MGRLFRAIKAGAFTLPTHLSGSARDLLKRMLTVDPLRRITIEEIRWAPLYNSSDSNARVVLGLWLPLPF